MQKKIINIDLTGRGMNVRTLEGKMAAYSTEALHAHGHHQLLRINSGVTMFVDAQQRQPMFGALTAFIPADFAHRSVVLGSPVRYKSIYLSKKLLPHPPEKIRLFFINALGAALFDRIQISRPQDLEYNFNRECLDLLLKILPDQMKNRAELVRLPEPQSPMSRDVVEFIKKRYADPLTMADFSKALLYSGRHLARMFKQEMKITLFEYVRLYRILSASLALCQTNQAVTRIGLDSGYTSLSSFYRDFNMIYAVAPKVFRKTFSRAAGDLSPRH